MERMRKKAIIKVTVGGNAVQATVIDIGHESPDEMRCPECQQSVRGSKGHWLMEISQLSLMKVADDLFWSMWECPACHNAVAWHYRRDHFNEGI